MKRMSIRLAGLVILCLFAFGCTVKQVSVAVVNTDQIYKDSESGKAGIAYLDGLSKELEAELSTLQEKSVKAGNKKTAQAEMQQALMLMQQRFAAEQQQVITVLNTAYQKALDNVRNQQKLNVIVASDMVLTYDKEVDVTNKVIADMDSRPIVFEPLKAE